MKLINEKNTYIKKISMCLFLSITLGLGTIASKSILSQDKNIRNEVLEASKIDIDFINEKTNEEYKKSI